MIDRQWERVAAVLVLVFVALTVASLFTLSTPDLDDSAVRIAAELREHDARARVSILGILAVSALMLLRPPRA